MDNYNNYNDETQVLGGDQIPYAPQNGPQPIYSQASYGQYNPQPNPQPDYNQPGYGQYNPEINPQPAPQPNYNTPAPVYNQPNYNQPNYNQPNYNQPNYGQPNYGQPGRMVTPKNLAVCIILSLVTCGIYLYYWLYCLAEDTNALSGDPSATSGGMVVLLSIVTCGIYLYYWMFKQGERLDQIKTARGLPSGNSGILYLILGLFGLSIVSMAMMQNEINKLVA